jgi:hypothetical protein
MMSRATSASLLTTGKLVPDTIRTVSAAPGTLAGFQLPATDQVELTPPTQVTMVPPVGVAVTVTVVVPLTFSLVPMIVAVPNATPVTTPVELTRTMAVSLLLHITGRSISGVPFLALGVAVS